MRLVDTQPFRYQLVESEQSHGRTRVRGVFQRADEKNANGRVYSRKLWEKILSEKEIKESIDRRRMIGEVDHPADSELKLSKAAIVVTGLQLGENKEIIGEMEILPTEYGKHVSALFEAGVELGISSRGEGTTYTKEGVEYINENDYNLITFDIVATPSTRGAYPTVIRESAEERSKTEEGTMAITEKFLDLKKKARSLTEVDLSKTTSVQREALRNEAEQLMESIDRVVVEDPGLRSIAESVTSDLRETAKAAGSKSAPPVLESQLDAAEAVISEMVEQVASRDRKLIRTVSHRMAEKLNRLSEALISERAKNRALVIEASRLRRTLKTAEAVGEEIVNQYVDLSKHLKENAQERRPRRAFRTEARRPVKRALRETTGRRTSDFIREKFTSPKMVRRIQGNERPENTGAREQASILESIKRNGSFKL